MLKKSFSQMKKPQNDSVLTDLTVAQDGDVVSWQEGTIWKISTQDKNKRILFNTDCYCMFAYCENLTKIIANNFNTENCPNGDRLFTACKKLPNFNDTFEGVSVEMCKSVEEGGYFTKP